MQLSILALNITGGKDHFGHLLNPRSIRQRQVLLKDCFHARQKDPLQPLLEVQRIDRKRLNAGERLSGWRDIIPPSLHPQFTLDQQQLLGNPGKADIHHDETFAF
ncbi:hypothetical protein D3C81_2019650 [compost metagenome]